VQIRYDPFDATIIDDPYPTYRLLRDEEPVYHAAESDTWVLSRHDDVETALLDHDSYSSVGGVFPTPPGSNFVQSMLPMMILIDPPRHNQLRALVSRGFTPRRIAALNDGIEELAQDLVGRLGDRAGSADFVADFAGVLPAVVIADLLGVPREDRDQFRQWSTMLVQADPTHGKTADGLSAMASMYGYFTDFLADRRRGTERRSTSTNASRAPAAMSSRDGGSGSSISPQSSLEKSVPKSGASSTSILLRTRNGAS